MLHRVCSHALSLEAVSRAELTSVAGQSSRFYGLFESTFMPVLREQVEDEAHDEGKGRPKDDAKPHHAPLSVPDCTTHSRSSSCTKQFHWLADDRSGERFPHMHAVAAAKRKQQQVE